MIRYPLTLLALLLVSLGALLFVAACGDDDSPLCPEYEVGVLEGRVTSAGEGVAATIEARAWAWDQDDPFEGSVTTESDSTGYYRMELPSGLYRLILQDSNDFDYYSTPADTVRIGPGSHHLDLVRGRLVVTLAVPDVFEDERFRLDCRGDDDKDCSGRMRVTDGQVVFDFGLITPGVYRLHLNPFSTSDFYLPYALNSSNASLFEIGDDRVVHYQQDLVANYSSISGKITGSWVENGTGNLSITAFSTDQGSLAHGDCEDDGSFFLPVLLPRPCRLVTHNNGIEQWIGGDSFETATTFDLQPGNPISDLVHAESGLTLQINGPETSSRYHLDAVLRTESGQELKTDFYGEGPFHISNLRPERYFLFLDGTCRGQAWAPTWYGGNENFDSAVAIDLGVGERKTITMDLREGGRIEGGIRFPIGFGDLVTAYRLYDETGQTICNPWFWDDDEMLFTGLPNGDFLVAAVITGSSPWFYPGTWDSGLAEPVTITDYGRVVVEWDLPGIIPEVVR